MASSRREDHTSGPASPEPADPPDLPASLSLWSLIWGAIHNTGKTVRLICIAFAAAGCIAVILDAAKGVHVHWPVLIVPAGRLPTLTGVGGVALTLAAIGIKKAISGWWKERKRKRKEQQEQQELQRRRMERQEMEERKRRQEPRPSAPRGAARTRARSSGPSPKQDQQRLRSRQLRHTTRQPGRSHPRPGWPKPPRPWRPHLT
jgi:hypothetical protein